MNYAKAIEILDHYIHVPSRGPDLIGDLWRYKLELQGDTAENRALLVAEINTFVSDHLADGFGLLSALEFVGGHSWVPDEIAEKLVQVLGQKTQPLEPREYLLEIRAQSEPDRDKRAALLRVLIKEFPRGRGAASARRELFTQTGDLADREKWYSEIHATAPEDVGSVAEMARVYLDANQKLPQALALLDEADRQLDLNSKSEQASPRSNEQQLKFWKGRIAVIRADILIRQGKPKEALVILQPWKNEFKLGWAFYVYGRALEGTGDKRAAVDAYLQSVVRVSQYQEDANTRLEKL